MTPPATKSPLLLPLDQLPDPLGLPMPSPRVPSSSAASTLPVQTPCVRPPGSKSLTNRAILLAALADGVCVLRRPLLDADDARVMLDAVQAEGNKGGAG